MVRFSFQEGEDGLNITEMKSYFTYPSDIVNNGGGEYTIASAYSLREISFDSFKSFNGVEYGESTFPGYDIEMSYVIKTNKSNYSGSITFQPSAIPVLDVDRLILGDSTDTFGNDFLDYDIDFSFRVIRRTVKVMLSYNGGYGTVSELRVKCHGKYLGLPNPQNDDGPAFIGWKLYGRAGFIDASTKCEIFYDHTLSAIWSNTIVPVTNFDASINAYSERLKVSSVGEFGKYASCRKKIPNSPQDLDLYTGFTNYKTGIPKAYDYTGSAPNVSDTIDHDVAGGERALLSDINAIGELCTRLQYFLQSGGLNTFSDDVARVIGGYPRGATLEYYNGKVVREVTSLIDDNMYNFVLDQSFIDGVRWDYADVTTIRNIAIFPDLDKHMLYTFHDFESVAAGTKNSCYMSEWYSVPYDCMCIVSIHVGLASGWPQEDIVEFGFYLRNSDGSRSESDLPEVDGIIPLQISYARSGESALRTQISAGTLSTCFFISAGSSIRIVSKYKRADIVRTVTTFPLVSRR